MRYALLDSLNLVYELADLQVLNPNHVSLYRGPEDPQMAEMAPLLFWYVENDPFAHWLEQQWGNARGIGIYTMAPPDELRKHLRRFLRIRTDDGEQLYFRYYDPRVLNVFLPTCDADQLKTFFGPVTAYVTEDPVRGQTWTYTLHNGQLVTDTVARAEPVPVTSLK